jgi:EPS-associated MarR family transcriptional regulator
MNAVFRTGIAVAIPSVESIQNHQDRHSMTSRRAKLHQDTNFRLMKILEANPDLSQREMGKALGISFGGINYCLNALVAKGLVKIENFSQNQNKFGYVYLLTPSGIAEKAALTSVFLKRKMEEYEALKLEIAMLKSEIDAKNGEKPSEK